MSKECRSKKRRYTITEQRVAAEILTEFMFCKDMDEMREVWKQTYNQYNLADDPFTRTPCSLHDYLKASEEYADQIMARRFGG